MEEQVVVENEGLSFSDIWKIIKKYWVGLVSIVAGCLIVGVLAAYFLVPKKYEASQRIYYNGDARIGETVNKDGEVDLNTSSVATNISIQILQDRVVHERTAEKLNASGKFKEEVDYKDLVEQISIQRTNELSITFYYSSKEKAEIPFVLNTFTETAIDYLKNDFGRFEFRYAHAVRDEDVYDSSTSKFLVVGASGVVGLIFGLSYEFIANAADKTIRNKNYLEETYGIKVIGLIPDLEKLKKEETEE